jgi:hypothetical protein
LKEGKLSHGFWCIRGRMKRASIALANRININRWVSIYSTIRRSEDGL